MLILFKSKRKTFNAAKCTVTIIAHAKLFYRTYNVDEKRKKKRKRKYYINIYHKMMTKYICTHTHTYPKKVCRQHVCSAPPLDALLPCILSRFRSISLLHQWNQWNIVKSSTNSFTFIKCYFSMQQTLETQHFITDLHTHFDHISMLHILNWHRKNCVIIITRK